MLYDVPILHNQQLTEDHDAVCNGCVTDCALFEVATMPGARPFGADNPLILIGSTGNFTTKTFVGALRLVVEIYRSGGGDRSRFKRFAAGALRHVVRLVHDGEFTTPKSGISGLRPVKSISGFASGWRPYPVDSRVAPCLSRLSTTVTLLESRLS
jgi:hypothetical protein